jgi:inosine/xanthosine triphosphatase
VTRERLRVVVASKNPVKQEAARRGFGRVFADRVFADRELTVEGVSVDSGVAAQPRTDDETLRGATQRARAARAASPEADYWVGMEGGLAENGPDLLGFAWIVVVDAAGREGRARTAGFVIPKPVRELVEQGLELGEADDRVFSRQGSKREEGAVGILTRGLIDRTNLYEPAVVLALIPFLQPELY